MGNPIKLCQGGRDGRKRKRGDKNGSRTVAQKFHFFDLKRQLSLLLRLFAASDAFAHLARMLAVKGPGQRVASGFRLKIGREHVRPGKSLEQCPMPAGRTK